MWNKPGGNSVSTFLVCIANSQHFYQWTTLRTVTVWRRGHKGEKTTHFLGDRKEKGEPFLFYAMPCLSFWKRLTFRDLEIRFIWTVIFSLIFKFLYSIKDRVFPLQINIYYKNYSLIFEEVFYMHTRNTTTRLVGLLLFGLALLTLHRLLFRSAPPVVLVPVQTFLEHLNVATSCLD